MFAGLSIGIVLGALLQRSQFCTMGALSDYFLFGSWRRLRIWVLAASIGILATQFMVLQNVIDLSATHYASAPLRPMALLFGGIAFGWGMVLAGGCASRNLVRAGQGSLKALVATASMIVAAVLVSSGPLSAVTGFADLGIELPNLPKTLPSVLGLAIAAILACACLFFQLNKKQMNEAGIAFGLGALAALSWVWSMNFPGQVPPAPASIDLVSSSSDFMLWLTINKTPGFGAALMAGTALGAFCLAFMFSSIRLETFSNSDDMTRHIMGGLAMGFGGSIAIGDTFGHGVSGISALSIGSIIALAGIAGGAKLGLLQLEAGSFAALLGKAGIPGFRKSNAAGQ